jgi:hypothetical protein
MSIHAAEGKSCFGLAWIRVAVLDGAPALGLSLNTDAIAGRNPPGPGSTSASMMSGPNMRPYRISSRSSLRTGPGRYCSPRHGMPFVSRNEGTERIR